MRSQNQPRVLCDTLVSLVLKKKFTQRREGYALHTDFLRSKGRKEKREEKREEKEQISIQPPFVSLSSSSP